MSLGRRLYAVVLVALMAIGAFSLWTVVPIGWLWIASQIVGTQEPHFGAYMLVLAGILVSVLAIGKSLGALNRRFVSLTGLDDGQARIPLPWMRSMRDEHRVVRATPLDAVLVVSTVLAALALVIWFFLGAGSPLPG